MQSLGTETLGLIAGTLTTISFMPQVLKVARTRQTRDLSLLMYSVFCLGVTGWLIYGLLIGSVAVIAANAVTLVLAMSIVIMKLRFG